MQIYELAIGSLKHFVAATNEQHAYEQGADPEKYPDIHFLPFQITPVVVPGHTITVTSDSEEPAPTKRGRRSAS